MRVDRLCSRRSRPGVTLIMVAGVLVVLSAVGAGFYAVSVSQVRTSSRQEDTTRAYLMAQAGLADAVARLGSGIFERPESPSEPWYAVDYLNGAVRKSSFRKKDLKAASGNDPYLGYSRTVDSLLAPDSERYILSIVDAQSKININAGENLGVLLDNLCRVVGSPLVAADLNYLQPRRWNDLGATGYNGNAKDVKPDASSKAGRDIYYELDTSANPRPILRADGTALYGDGYAIAGYRSRLKNGRFNRVEDVRAALTVRPNPAHPEQEDLEREIKFIAIRDFITVDSWIDTTTVCTGKFEWATETIAVDRDKSWVADDPNDKLNTRGSLRGSYISIVSGQGAGQFRRIKTNGIDWIEIEKDAGGGAQGFTVVPGPISNYMIIAKPDALPDPYLLPSQGAAAADSLAYTPQGVLKDNPDIDYRRYPLCIHRAPINVNTASDKVLAAVFLGLNVQHGHPMAVGTNADRTKLSTAWKVADSNKLESKLVTLVGAQRVPQDTGKPVLDCNLSDLTKALNPKDPTQFNYISNYGTLSNNGNFDTGSSAGSSGDISEAHELAFRIISARQRKLLASSDLPYYQMPLKDSDPDPLTADAQTKFDGFERGPFRSWDDFYFRVVKPWDDVRSYGVLADYGRSSIPYASAIPLKANKKISVAKLIMAQVNPNTDILKFNPNIEWIDRWGRNFTEMEPIMVYAGNAPKFVNGSGDTAMWNFEFSSHSISRGAYYQRSMRYKSDEMIDKTDINRGTTELCFFSNGVFEITSIGQVVKGGTTLAERKVRATVRAYNIWRETTQLQFSQGTFDAPGGMGNPGDTNSGQITRDALNVSDRKPLNTQPEPLVPLKSKIVDTNINDVADPGAPKGRDIYGSPKPPGQPDVVANHVFPAIYDGQIVLAANTDSYNKGDEACTFLASFNGDLDTDTCQGNGRELAKTPYDRTKRVVDSIGLLGVLNDTEIDYDPVESIKQPGAANPAPAYNIFTTNDPSQSLFGPLTATSDYYNNVSIRSGDLRTDGVWLGYPGVSGKESTLKWLYEKNHNAASTDGITVMMWFKSCWHTNDNREHEFYNISRCGPAEHRGVHFIKKAGYFSECYPRSGYASNSFRIGNNDLSWCTDGLYDSLPPNPHFPDFNSNLHGGFRGVPAQANRESPSFHFQPFRWATVGGVYKWNDTWPDNPRTEVAGWFASYNGSIAKGSAQYVDALTKYFTSHHTFTDTMRDPPGNWSYQYYWKDAIQNNVVRFGMMVGTRGNIWEMWHQPVIWPWCDGGAADLNNAGDPTTAPIFGINNLGWDRKPHNNIRTQPIDGTMGVIDEFKLCNKKWTEAQLKSRITACRYYTPANPAADSQCPTFTSQSMQRSLFGTSPDAAAYPSLIKVARVTWSGFNPRFNYENRELVATRQEIVAGAAASVRIHGPFDYVQYNMDVLRNLAFNEKLGNEGTVNSPQMVASVATMPLGCERMAAPDYYRSNIKIPHYANAFQVWLLWDSAANPGAGAPIVSGKTFNSPEEENVYDIDAKKNPWHYANELHYRVRFRYRADRIADLASRTASTSPGPAAGDDINPQLHFVLDTPVFDDITVCYVTPQPQYIDFKEELE